MKSIPIHRPLLLAAALALGLAAQAQTTITLSSRWSIAAGERPYVSGPATNTERGIAVNPVNGHVYVVSRNGGLQVAILDGATGAELGFLNIDGVSGGTFALSCIGVGEDGAIYGANLSGSSTVFSSYRIYRWADESAIPELIFGPAAPGPMMARYGDSFDVRGAGTDTQIVASGSASGEVAVFTLAFDGALWTATPTAFDLSTAGVGVGEMGKGLCFGIGNTLYGRVNGSTTLRHVSFDLAAGTLAKVRDINVPASLVPVVVGITNQVLAAVETANAASPHNLNLYDLSDPAAATLPILGTIPFPTTPGAANGNLVGAIDLWGTTIAGVDPNNGIVCATMNFVSTVIPPGIASQPAGANVLEGGYYSMTVSATGTKPLDYQWSLNDVALPGKTEPALTLQNVTAADAGNYTVRVSNSAGDITSAAAIITVTPTVRTDALTPVWSLATGSVPWLATDNTCRSLAYNPVSGNLLVLSRTPTTAIHVVNSANGQIRHTMNIDPSIVFGGTFPLNMVGVADDGAVYACNLTTDAAGTQFAVYRWDNDSADAVPTPIFLGDPSNGAGTSRRYGDTMDVRGAGLTTQILVASRAARIVCILSTPDGFTWSGIPIEVAAAGEGDFGLGACFGADNSFWGKAAGRALAHIGFDLAGYDPLSSPPVPGTVLHSYPTNQIPAVGNNIMVNLQSNVLAMVSTETPDNVRLYDLADLTAGPVLMDTEFFPTDNANGNGTGSADFGGGLLFALDTNNGIAAYSYKRVALQPGPIAIARAGNTITVTWSGSYKLQSAPAVNGPWNTLEAATSPHTVDTATAPATFYRLSN